MAAIQSQDEKAALAAGKKPTLTGISSSPTTKPTPVASLDQQPRVTVSSSSEKKVKTENQYTKVTPPKQTIKQEPEKTRKPSGSPVKSIVVHSTTSKSYERTLSRKDSKGKLF